MLEKRNRTSIAILFLLSSLASACAMSEAPQLTEDTEDPALTESLAQNTLAVIGRHELRLYATDGTTRTIALPGATGGEVWANAPDYGSRWMLLHGEGGQLWRADLQAARADRLELGVPSGYRAHDDCGFDASTADVVALDNSDGSLYGLFRTDQHAAVFVSSDGQDWLQVGGTITQVGGVDVYERSGTYVIRGREAGYCYGAGAAWSENASADFSGEITQLVRRSTGASVSLSSEPYGVFYDLDRTGRYATFEHSEHDSGERSLRLIDIETGTQTDVAIGEGTSSMWIATPTLP